MRELRKACVGEVFDYGILMSMLSYLKAPHRKITELLKSGDIVRIKKGLYIFGEDYRHSPVHLGQLANLIYGPSYVSQEYALYWYGLIPERVDLVMSMTTGRKKLFQTPVGVFQYTYINVERFTVGIDLQSIDDQQHFLIASPEKALADTVADQNQLQNTDDMREHLSENLRIEDDMILDLNLDRMQKIQLAYRKPVVTLLFRTLKEGI